MELDDILDIINSSDLEDVLILNENYERLLEELGDDNDKIKYIMLSSETERRISELRQLEDVA